MACGRLLLHICSWEYAYMFAPTIQKIMLDPWWQLDQVAWKPLGVCMCVWMCSDRCELLTLFLIWHWAFQYTLLIQKPIGITADLHPQSVRNSSAEYGFYVENNNRNIITKPKGLNHKCFISASNNAVMWHNKKHRCIIVLLINSFNIKK